MFGRKVIYSDAVEITDANVIDEITKAMLVHSKNQREIDYLHRYRKGDQPILYRVKDIRPEINNKIVENRADEIVNFKTGYLMGEPIQYVSRSDDKLVSDAITKLNSYMQGEDKETKDTELSDWFYTAGTSYRMVLPDGDADVEADEAPFEIYTLDPRFTFVVYQNALGGKPLMGVTYVDRAVSGGEAVRVFSIYTENHYYELEKTSDYKIVSSQPQILGIPIVEYPLSPERLGAFETVLTMLDAINITASNRVDGVEQFIQALLKFHNVDISSEDFKNLREEGAIKYSDKSPDMKGDIEYLIAELDQGQTQTLVDHMYNTVLTLCGMPNRNGGSSTSDTGTAVIYRDGFAAAEGRAKKDEMFFKQSERRFLKIILRICRDLSGLNLKISDIEIRFTRRNYENITEKANVLNMLLNNPKVAPQLAFTYCGMFSDPNIAYQMSKEYADEQEKKMLENQSIEGNPDKSPDNNSNSSDNSQ